MHRKASGLAGGGAAGARKPAVQRQASAGSTGTGSKSTPSDAGGSLSLGIAPSGPYDGYLLPEVVNLGDVVGAVSGAVTSAVSVVTGVGDRGARKKTVDVGVEVQKRTDAQKEAQKAQNGSKKRSSKMDHRERLRKELLLRTEGSKSRTSLGGSAGGSRRASIGLDLGKGKGQGGGFDLGKSSGGRGSRSGGGRRASGNGTEVAEEFDPPRRGSAGSSASGRKRPEKT